MLVQLLVSTYNDRVYSLQNTLPSKQDNVSIIIVHQVTNGVSSYESILSFFNSRDDIIYYRLFSSGVTKSRNYALSVSFGDVLLLCDDDTCYKDDFYDILTKAYSENPDADVITFPILIKGTEQFTKNYKLTKKKHNLFSVLKVGTIEISLRRKCLESNDVFFPENLGAGSKYPMCDEPVFLSRFLHLNKKVIYVPTPFVSHEMISSGSVIDSYEKLCSRFIAFSLMYGRFFGSVIFALFTVKKIKKIAWMDIVKQCFSNG
ncbi:glycosyltransferase family A protein [Vibrio cholerae]|uniref:glycosyltransferase family A protein n=1 Tax=Vibrio cholerae TaxID=666 RepID=UPI003967300C